MDSTDRKVANAICDCLNKHNVDSIQNSKDAETIFATCMLENSSGALGKLLEGGDMEKAGEEWGRKIAMDLFAVGCQSFIQISMKIASSGEEKTTSVKASAKTLQGTIINVEEKELLYLTLRSSTNREYKLVYLSYIPGSDEWIKNPSSLKGKKVTIDYVETEIYQPKLKEYVDMKQVKMLKQL